jgi:hypothetical protein
MADTLAKPHRRLQFTLRKLFVAVAVLGIVAVTLKALPGLIAPVATFVALVAISAIPAALYLATGAVVRDELRLQRVADSAFGLLPLGLGCAILMYVYAFASMVDPRLPASERLALILRKMFLSPNAPLTVVGLALVAVGGCILLFGVASLFMRVEPGRFAVRSAIAASVAAVLFTVVLFLLG